MNKVKFIGLVIAAVIFFYLLLTVFMPIFVTVTDNATTAIEASTYNATYVGSKEGLQYSPLVLYFAPAVIGVSAIMWKLRQSE